MLNKLLVLGYVSYVIMNKKYYESVSMSDEIVNIKNIKNKLIASEKIDDKMNVIVNKDTAKTLHNITSKVIIKSYDTIKDFCCNK